MGLAYLNTLDQGAQAIENIFVRMKALAVQASNGAMTANDRYGLDAEFGVLVENGSVPWQKLSSMAPKL